MEHEIVIYFQAYPEQQAGLVHQAYPEQQAGPEHEAGKARLQHRLGRSLLKKALAKEYQIDFTEEMISYADNGKPLLKNVNDRASVFFNISHCEGMVVCALADCPIGIDVEGSRRVTDSLIRSACSDWEKTYVAAGGANGRTGRFLELWTLKESYLKMTGEGMRLPVDRISFQFSEAVKPETESCRLKAGLCKPEDVSCKPENGRWRTPSEIQSSREGCYYQTLVNDRYVLAVCAKEFCKEPRLVVAEL